MTAIDPIWSAFINADPLGKVIFMALFALSVASWTILAYKILYTYAARRASTLFQKQFFQQGAHPLSQTPSAPPSPFHSIHAAVKNAAARLFRLYGERNPDTPPSLTQEDLDFLHGHAQISIREQIRDLEKNLFVLTTTVSLAPFLGLLGTVWGILITFGGLSQGLGRSHELVLNGLSMALATTVLGLIIVIPALVALLYLRSMLREFTLEMENFAEELLNELHLQYR